MTYLDANVIIRLIEAGPDEVEQLRNAVSGETEFVTSLLTRLEVRILPLRDGNEGLLKLYDAFFSRGDLIVWPIDQQVIDRATHLRATSSIKVADAIHVASAIEAGANELLTGDRRIRSIGGTSVRYV